ncbi:MAG: amidophosphoribosyltransferase [Thermodesulfobacteriota bacterium]|nr:amidophosphoribosyltransferase [Thermodesulfobacteriota bacterium]
MGGFFGCVSDRDCVADVFYGTDYHSHLGTKRGGLVFQNRNGMKKSIKKIENTYFRTKLEPELAKLTGEKGLGVISDTDAQPLIIGSHLGTFAIVMVGKINNLDELARDAFNQGLHFSEASEGAVNPTELVAMLINQAGSFAEGIARAQDMIRGSCSLLLLTAKGIYAARDRLGRTPVVVGRKNGTHAVSSESCAFFNLGYETERYLGPGEIVYLTADGYEQLKPPGEASQVCAFLWVYYGYPPSSYEDINVEAVRYRCGWALADRDDTLVDYVSGIPDSGIGHAIGYANKKQIPYRRPFVKYTPTWPRSFMPQDQSMRDLVAKMKLIPIPQIIEGQRVMFCDDSIVRGTQLQDNIRILFDFGAKEVHMRTACPTLIYPCEYLNFSASRSTLDLIGRQVIHELEGGGMGDIGEYARAGSEKHTAMVAKIRERLLLTSLKFQRLDDLIAAIGLPKERVCTHCWDGSSYG